MLILLLKYSIRFCLVTFIRLNNGMQQHCRSQIFASNSQKMTEISEIGCFDQTNQKYTIKIHLKNFHF